jgi:hypothetical protein
MALQPGVSLGLLYSVPPGFSIPCSVSPFVHPHLSQIPGHVFQPSHFWFPLRLVAYSLPYNIFLGLRYPAFFLYDPAVVFFGF